MNLLVRPIAVSISYFRFRIFVCLAFLASSALSRSQQAVIAGRMQHRSSSSHQISIQVAKVIGLSFCRLVCAIVLLVVLHYSALRSKFGGLQDMPEYELPHLPDWDREGAIQRQEVTEQCALKKIPLVFEEYVHIGSNVSTCPQKMVQSIVAKVCYQEEEKQAEPQVESQETAIVESAALERAQSATPDVGIF